MNVPKVSVLMAVYNGEIFLRDAVESILKQTYSNFEFLIINDGSTDSTVDIINSYKDGRICLISNQANIGLTKSLNKGLSIARGEYIARQDDDDISHSRRLEKQVDYLEKHPNIALLGSQASVINEYGELQKAPIFYKLPLTWDCIRWYCMVNNPFVHSAVMMRKDLIWNKYGGYNTSFKTSQDYELWSRIVYDNVCENLNEILLDLRIYSMSISANYSKRSMNDVAIIYKHSIKKGINQDTTKNWINQWVFKNNPSWYPGKVDVKYIAEKIETMFNDFCSFNNISNEKDELLLFKHYLLLKIAYKSSNIDKRTAIKLFFKVLSKEKRISYRVVPQYILKLIFGSQLKVLINQIKPISKKSRNLKT